MLPAFFASLIAGNLVLVARTHWQGAFPIRFLLIDDAMISMNFACSLVEGCGLVWYCGYPRVEGYTNLGWVLYMAFWHLWGLPSAYTSLPLLLTGLATLVWHIRELYRLGEVLGGEAIGKMAAWFAAAFPPFWFHHTSGLETGFLTALLTFMARESLREAPSPFRLPAAAALGTLIRMDFLVWVAALTGAEVLRNGLRSGRTSLPFSLQSVVPLLCTAGVAGGVALWRWNYYGAWVPNTYLLKVASLPPLVRVANGLLSGAWYVRNHLVLGALALWGVWKLRHSSGRLVLASLVGASLAYNAYVGGDIYEDSYDGSRFLFMGLSAVFVLAGVSARALGHVALQGTSLALVSLGIPLPKGEEVGERWKKAFIHARSAELFPLELHFRRGAVLYTLLAGSFPYFYPQFQWRDLMGKVDPHTAIAGDTVTCFRFPPLLFYQGHTRANWQGLLAEGEGCTDCWILMWACDSSGHKHTFGASWWDRYLPSWFFWGCQDRSPPSYSPFSSQEDSLRFCTHFTLIPGSPNIWKRKKPPSDTTLSLVRTP